MINVMSKVMKFDFLRIKKVFKKNESITGLCPDLNRRWGQKLLMLFFSSAIKSTIKKFSHKNH